MLVLLVLACAPDPGETGASPESPMPWVAPDQRGPYEAGVTTLQFTDSRGKELKVEVWYPAVPDSGDTPDPYEEIRITREAYRDAPPDLDHGPYPLAAFSHGYSAIRYQSVFLTEPMAQHGWVVVAPDHEGNTMLDLDEDRTGLVMMERPGDVMAAVDQALALSESGDPLLGGLIRDDGYAMLGHSFGAVTTQEVAGGQLDWDATLQFCSTWDNWICDFIETVDPTTLDQYPTEDPRARVAVPMAPGAWYVFGAWGSGLQSVRDPLVWGGTRDDVLPYDTEIRPCYDAMGSPKRMATLQDAGHYAFSDICQIASFLFDDCDGAEGGFIDMERAHEIIRPLVLAYLGRELLGDDRYGPWLEPDWTGQIPELTWEEE